MKKTLPFVFVCLIFIVKVSCTLLIPLTNGETMYFSISAFLVLILLPTNETQLVLKMIGICLILAIWLIIIILCILGIKFKKAKILSIVFVILAAMFDWLLPLVFSDIKAKIVFSIINLIILCVGLSCLFALKKTNKIKNSFIN